MLLYKNEVLIVRSSHKIYFFKQERDDDDQETWKVYSELQEQGRLSGNKTCNQFQIVQDDYINFYEIDDDGQPKLLNVMLNFLECGMMIYGEEQIFCITFKMN